MLYGVIANIIEDEFRQKFIHGNKCFTNEAMLLRFGIRGNRKVELLIHGPSRYIAVYTREIQGRDEALPWKVWCYHDSCWSSDGVDRVMSHYADSITFLPTAIRGWYSTVTLSQEQLDELKEVRKMRYQTT